MSAADHRPVAFVPVRQSYYSRDLACDVRRTVGYRAYCSCGHVGPVKATVALARYALRDHAAGGDTPMSRGATP